MLCNMLGQVCYTTLEQFLTLFFSFLFLWGLKLFFCFQFLCFSKNANLKETPKRKNIVCEHTCSNCSCLNVRFSAFFIFGVFGISNFWRDVFDR